MTSFFFELPYAVPQHAWKPQSNAEFDDTKNDIESVSTDQGDPAKQQHQSKSIGRE